MDGVGNLVKLALGIVLFLAKVTQLWFVLKSKVKCPSARRHILCFSASACDIKLKLNAQTGKNLSLQTETEMFILLSLQTHKVPDQLLKLFAGTKPTKLSDYKTLLTLF